MSKPILIIVVVVVVLVVAAGSFYGGMTYGKSQTSTAASAGFQGVDGQGAPGDFQGFRGQGQNGAAGARTDAVQPGSTFGQIESIDGNTLSVTDRNGNPVTVQVTDTTLIEKNASVSVSDLAAGDTVIISGSDNSDGSITARSVQVAPAGRFFGGGDGQLPGGASGGASNGQSQ